MVLVIDNYDSFTWNLVDYVEQAGEKTIVVRNDEMRLEEIAELEFDSILIGPGPGIPQNSGITNSVVKEYWGKKPILGVCLGMQAIGEFCSWTLKKATKPMHGKVSELNISPHPIFEGVSKPLNVMRYHSLIIEEGTENNELKVLARTKEGEVMAIASEQNPIVGFQFHPESILTQEGLLLMKNWFTYIQ